MTQQIDLRAKQPSLLGGLRLGRSKVLRSLRHYLRAQSQGLHTIDRLEEIGVERGSASFTDRKYSVVKGVLYTAKLGARNVQ